MLCFAWQLYSQEELAVRWARYLCHLQGGSTELHNIFSCLRTIDSTHVRTRSSHYVKCATKHLKLNMIHSVCTATASCEFKRSVGMEYLHWTCSFQLFMFLMCCSRLVYWTPLKMSVRRKIKKSEHFLRREKRYSDHCIAFPQWNMKF